MEDLNIVLAMAESWAGVAAIAASLLGLIGLAWLIGAALGPISGALTAWLHFMLRRSAARAAGTGVRAGARRVGGGRRRPQFPDDRSGDERIPQAVAAPCRPVVGGDRMNALRTVLFRLAFYALSVPVVLAGPLTIPFGRRAVQRYAHGWVRMHRWLARAILGVRVRVEGALYDGPALYVPAGALAAGQSYAFDVSACPAAQVAATGCARGRAVVRAATPALTVSAAGGLLGAALGPSAQADLAAQRRLLAADGAQQSRLATAVRPQQGREPPARNGQVEPLDHPPPGIPRRQPPRFQRMLRHRPVPHRRAFHNSQPKNGAPRKPVISPTGTCAGGISRRATTSAATR